jgi:hypothetical protein
MREKTTRFVSDGSALLIEKEREILRGKGAVSEENRECL